jgi:hypothetical protein
MAKYLLAALLLGFSFSVALISAFQWFHAVGMAVGEVPYGWREAGGGGSVLDTSITTPRVAEEN